jgi:hypothetical protein
MKMCFPTLFRLFWTPISRLPPSVSCIRLPIELEQQENTSSQTKQRERVYQTTTSKARQGKLGIYGWEAKMSNNTIYDPWLLTSEFIWSMTVLPWTSDLQSKHVATSAHVLQAPQRSTKRDRTQSVARSTFFLILLCDITRSSIIHYSSGSQTLRAHRSRHILYYCIN